MRNYKLLTGILFIGLFTMSLTTAIIDNNYDKETLMKFYIPNELPLKSTLPVNDRSLAEDLGELLFEKPSGVADVACSDCHASDNSFYAKEVAPSGGGKFKFLYNAMYVRLYDRISSIPIDKPNLKSPTAVNSALRDNMLWGGELGFNGFNKEVPISKLMAFNKGNSKEAKEAQVSAGHDGHLMEGLLNESRHDNMIQDLSMKSFGRLIDFQVIQCAISIFEQSLLTNNNRVNRVIRGLDKKIHSEKGMNLYVSHCYDCHNQDTLVYKIGLSEFEGRMRMTKDSADFGLIYVPRIENIKDSKGMFHSDENISYSRTLNRHRGVINKITGKENNYIPKLSRKEKGAIKTFIFKDLYDSDVLN